MRELQKPSSNVTEVSPAPSQRDLLGNPSTLSGCAACPLRSWLLSFCPISNSSAVDVCFTPSSAGLRPPPNAVLFRKQSPVFSEFSLRSTLLFRLLPGLEKIGWPKINCENKYHLMVAGCSVQSQWALNTCSLASHFLSQLSRTCGYSDTDNELCFYVDELIWTFRQQFGNK